LYPTIDGDGPAPAEWCTTKVDSPGLEWYVQRREPALPVIDITNYHAAYCGERDIAEPERDDCSFSATQLEHSCRNVNPDVVGEWFLNPAHPDAGPPGTCTNYAEGPPGAFDGNVDVDYTDCDADRQNYCSAFRFEFIAECNGATDCGAGDPCAATENIPLYDNLSLIQNAGPVHPCVSREIEQDVSSPTGVDYLLQPGRTFSYARILQIDAGDWETTGHSPDACGDLPVADCAASAQAFEDRCNSDGVGGYRIRDRDGNIPTAAYCQNERVVYEANCVEANACAGQTGGSPLINGIDTITTPAIGPGVEEVLEDQSAFGDFYNFVETAFNPGDYGLIAGEYVVGDHAVGGEGVTEISIDDSGSYASDWDFTFTAEAVDAPELTVEATLYEIVDNGFIFTGCSQADVQNVENGTCQGAITCTDYTPPCRIVDGVQICEAPDQSYGITQVLAPWSDFTSGIPEMCWALNVQIDDCVTETNCIGNPACVPACDGLPVELQAACLDDPCWITATGEEICLDSTSESWTNNLGDAGWIDDCQDLLDDDTCSLLPDMQCVIGMEDQANPEDIELCQLRQRFFDCGLDVTVPGVPGADDTDTTCGAQFRCFGDECANTTDESNGDFVRAAVASTAVTESTKDVDCDVAGNPETCTIFDGTDSRCRDPKGSYLGIIPDCCDESRMAGESVGSFVDYVQLARHSYRLARDPIVASWLARSTTLSSGLQNVVNAPAQIGRSASRAVVNGFNSALQWAGFDGVTIANEAANVQSGVTASATGFGPIQQFIATGVKNFLDSIGAEVLSDQLFQTTAEGTVTDWSSSQLGQMVGNVLAVIGVIYTIYSIIKILGNIIFACEEEELAFGIQQVNRMCHRVGVYCSQQVTVFGADKCVVETETYCCFSSPFARIINEQLRLQGIGPEWGEATDPNCDGIPISQLENVDWDLVDLSEWEAIMFEAGLVPDPRNPPLNFVPSDRHPGDSTGGSEGITSIDLQTGIIELVRDPLDEGRFDLEGAPLCQPDPDLMPWYDDEAGGC